MHEMDATLAQDFALASGGLAHHWKLPFLCKAISYYPKKAGFVDSSSGEELQLSLRKLHLRWLRRALGVSVMLLPGFEK